MAEAPEPAEPSGGSLADVLPSVLAVLAGEPRPDPLDLLARIGHLRQAVVLLIDGLGSAPLQLAARSVPLFDEVVTGRLGTTVPLTAPFPATTPVSLATFGSGRSPGVHGIVGFTVRVPGTDRVLTHIAWRGEPAARSWQPEPRLLEVAAAGGLRTVMVSDPAFAGSPLTDAAYGQVPYRGVPPGKATAQAVLAELAAGTRLVVGYHAGLDTAGHLHGMRTRHWRAEARRVAQLISAIADGLPADTALFVTADHGMLDVPLHRRADIDGDPRLRDGVAVVAGEPRVRYLYTVDGAAPDVRAAWTEVLGPDVAVYGRDELIDAGWYGPTSVEHAQRIGDLVAVCRTDFAVLASGHEPPAVSRLIGMHGSVTDAERAVPLLILRR